jgi:hypothetical protein
MKCDFLLAIGDSFSYPAIILIGVTSMSRILITSTAAQHDFPTGLGMALSGMRAGRHCDIDALAARGAG